VQWKDSRGDGKDQVAAKVEDDSGLLAAIRGGTQRGDTRVAAITVGKESTYASAW